jgi:tetratricopeptide (TPR) repeat protein
MLERLFAAMMTGPNLNCRPHHSRQRVDLTVLQRLGDQDPSLIIRQLLQGQERVRLVGRAVAPSRSSDGLASSGAMAWQKIDLDQADAVTRAWAQQQSVLHKLRLLAEDALDYEQDTGVQALYMGFPLLCLPPGSVGGSKRIMAPVAYLPVTLSVRIGAAPSVEIRAAAAGSDRVTPNLALLAWLEHQCERTIAELDQDAQGQASWQEVGQIARAVAGMLDLPMPAWMDESALDALTLVAAPRAEDAGDTSRGIVQAAVLGLFPQANQALLRDTQDMLREPQLHGPILPFIAREALLESSGQAQADRSPEAAPEPAAPATSAQDGVRPCLISAADPCQARAVRLAQQCRGLVIHGPPGTGKSQTITNIIGDHLARGQRVLFVCDKRTALDVVANRLEHLGLGSLCALIHDPRSDRRQLYQTLRTRLDDLVDLRTEAGASGQLARLDQELAALHDELAKYFQAVSDHSESDPSLHQQVARWLELADAPSAGQDGVGLTATWDEWQSARPALQDVLARAQSVRFAINPWSTHAGLSLEEFLSRPMTAVRSVLQQSLQLAQQADALAGADVLPFDEHADLATEAQQRQAAADALRQALAVAPAALIKRLGKWSGAKLADARRQLAGLEPQAQVLRQEALDVELSLALGGGLPTIAQINQRLATLDAYLSVARSWHAFLHWGKRSAATALLRPMGLTTDADSAQRLRGFFLALRARIAIATLQCQWNGRGTLTALPDDAALEQFLVEHGAALDLLLAVQPVKGLLTLVIAASGDAARAQALEQALRQAQPRARAIGELEQALARGGLLAPGSLRKLASDLRGGERVAQTIGQLLEQVDTLEGVLRTRQALADLPDAFASAAAALVRQDVDVSRGLLMLEKAALEAQIGRRCRQSPLLQKVDGHRLRTSLTRYRESQAARQQLVGKAILHLWGSRQRARLLAGTGSRLNGAGADLKRRLTLRGDRAMRLRQVIAAGMQTEGGDPLFDLCPVWMASPETVAQLFPRQAMFDVVIFDEASQCRLEEALPVLTRAQRVVVAGDPKQLPPTRFFETAVASSAQDEPQTDQELFEVQQGDVEDLLAAALNLEIQECYLDVHYRSRNADLIQFSNEHFYGSRLQPIPGHPANRVRYAPLTLRQVNGLYEDRCNETEAREVCRIINDLLRRADPPSIGVACFNLAQRDLILETLDDLADQDSEFAARLASARTRRGNGSYEGLFVRNLESVQGDERDHIIISTTYGPDRQGRFYRRFGPLGLAGGGRRLNVLVTRARHEVHLVTSIPPAVYRALPAIPPGAQAGGPWLLFAYLHYAEELAQGYEAMHARLEDQALPAPEVAVRPSTAPSPLACSVADRLLQTQAIGSTVHWGNDGFCVDIALAHPRLRDDVTIGILCDGARYPKADDAVEWDVFRASVLESQGWQLHRVWSPQLYRDPVAGLNEILASLEGHLARRQAQALREGEAGTSCDEADAPPRG